MRHVDAVVLTGGSAYGLAAADGVMTWLEEHGRGVAMDGGVVPIVPAAVIFDLPVGGWRCRPTAEFGYAAAAGRRHRCRGRHRRCRRRCARRACSRAASARPRSRSTTSGVTVGALVVGQLGGQRRRPRHRAAVDGRPDRRSSGWAPRRPSRWPASPTRQGELGPLNTTIAVVATDAALSPAGCRRVAVAAQDGLARTIRPAHTPLDGDTVFALATGAVEVEPDREDPGGDVAGRPLITAVGAAAADCLARAVLVGVLAAEAVAGIPTYRGLLPGAFASLKWS